MNQSGQSLLMGVLLLIVLLMAIPVIIALNQTVTRHGTMSQAKLKGRSIAEEGIAFAIQQLSQPGPPPTWPLSPGGALPTGFDGSQRFTSTQGGAYTINCSTGPQIYQYQVVASPLNAQGTVIPGSSIKTVVSQHTVGVKLPTGYSASAALEMMQVPTFAANSQLDVELGPIVCRDAGSTPWTLNPNTQRPRKFSAGCISARIADCANPTPPLTDQKEYWALTSPGFASVVDTNITPNSYQIAAQNSGCPAAPTCTTSADCTPSGPSNCDFSGVGPDTAVFNAGFTCTTPNCTVYVNGNAQIDGVTLNLLNGGAFIVNGNLTLGTNGDTAGPYTATTVPIPPTAALDDPFGTCGGASPCNGTTTRKMDFQGFLYATGNLAVAAGTFWTLDGVVRVDGATTLATNANALLYYNDIVNHNIRTSNFALQVDSTTAIP